MDSRKPMVYEGDENYIFISYAHSDSEEVFKIINRLDEEGYRLWYDDGITPGSEWPEDIAQHLNKSALFMTFITPNSVESSNCRREINYALSKEKPFLSVMLEKADMSMGLEMQLSSHQSIMKYNYRTWEGFIKKLLNTPALEPCRKPGPEPVAPVTGGEENDPESEDGTAAPSKESGISSKIRTRILIIAAAVVLLAAIGIYSPPISFKTSWGEEVAEEDIDFYATGKTFTQEDIDNIASMSSLRHLDLVDCDLSACDFKDFTFESDELGRIFLDGCTGINDYSFINDCTLYELAVIDDEYFSDISSIELDELYTINIDGSGVSDISVLSGAGELSTLNISNTQVKDLSAISSLSSLRELYFDGCEVELPSSLAALELDRLSCSGCGLSDMSSFSVLSRLEYLDISDNSGITDMDWLHPLNCETLKRINLSRTGLDRKDLEFIGKCSGLTCLGLRGLEDVGDLSFCRGLTDLESVLADGSGISDISGLIYCDRLENITLSFNDIENIDALSVLNPENITSIVLDISHNKISDLSALPDGHYHTILTTGNDSKLLSTMPKDVMAYQIIGDWFDGMATSGFASIRHASTTYIVGIPAAEQITAKELMDTDLIPITEKGLYELLARNMLHYNFYNDLNFSYPASLFNQEQSSNDLT